MFAPWSAAERIAPGPTPGARALMKVILARHPRARNLGIYAPRNVRGAGSLSLHAEGRAGDTGFPMDDGRGSAAGYELVEELRENAGDLGVQAIIYDRRIWSAKSPGRKGRPYTGAAPHFDHVHWELTRAAASGLTVARIKRILGAAVEPPVLRLGDSGPAVRRLQRLLKVTADGAYGPRTAAAVNDLKQRRGWATDGVAGPRVWAALEKGE